MKRSQSTSIIFAVIILTGILTSFKAQPIRDNLSPESKENVVDQIATGKELMGLWIKQGDPKSVILFRHDFTVSEKVKGKKTTNKWSVKGKELCIGDSDCISYEVKKDQLFLLRNNEKLVYKRPSEN